MWSLWVEVLVRGPHMVFLEGCIFFPNCEKNLTKSTVWLWLGVVSIVYINLGKIGGSLSSTSLICGVVKTGDGRAIFGSFYREERLDKMTDTQKRGFRVWRSSRMMNFPSLCTVDLGNLKRDGTWNVKVWWSPVQPKILSLARIRSSHQGLHVPTNEMISDWTGLNQTLTFQTLSHFKLQTSTVINLVSALI